MNKTSLKIVVGLGKTGVSCVRYLVRQGFTVVVVDSRIDPPGVKEVQQKFPEVKIYLGGFYPEVLEQAEEIIVSPGVSLHEPAIEACIKNGISVIGDVELFARVVLAPVIAITGSNGKSTVTSLVGMMAQAAGKKVKVGGNLGEPVLDLLDPKAELYVLELSSFQLETTNSLRPRAATVLNISPDHMDRYQNLDEYLMAKQRVYSGCQVAVINRDDSLSYSNVDLPSTVVSFGVDKPALDNFGVANGCLVCGDMPLLAIEELKIKGLHNVANALAAFALGAAVKIPVAVMVQSLRNFSGLPHRCQWVANINGVDWYNDSKGTNVGATKSAIEGLGAGNEGKTVLILGGISKEANFTILRETIVKYVHTVVLFGRDAKLIEQALIGTSKFLYADTMQEVVNICARAAVVGDIVLFSPACASLDMFNNFEHRGEVFMQEVTKLTS